MPTLVLKDFSGGLQEDGAGAPDNQFKVAQNFRITEDAKLETVFGYELDDSNSSRYRVAADANGLRRIGLMVPAHYGAAKTKALFKVVGERIQYNNGTSIVNLQGPASADAFDVSGVDSNTRYSSYTFREQFYLTHDELNQKPVFFYNTSGTPTLRTAGLPAVNRGAALGTVTASGGATSGYLWAFCYKYTYTVNGITFTIRGRPLYLLQSALDDEGSTSITTPAAFVLTNATGEHYDVSNAKLEAYRTQLNGSVYFYYGERAANTNGTITNAIDITRSLYTTGGVAENSRPPTCKYMTATTSFAYYAYGYDIVATTGSTYDNDLDLYPNRIWQSKPGQPSAVPQENFAEVEESITGISSAKSIPIVFTENYVYRVDGQIDSYGRGSLIPKRISESTGCVNHNSIVQTVDGVFFAGNDGFYFTDGFILTELSKNFRNKYAAIVQNDTRKKLISGAFDQSQKEVVWTCCYDDYEGSATEANALFIFDTARGTFTGPHTSGFNNIDSSDGTEDVEFSGSAFVTNNASPDVSIPTASLTGTIAVGDVFVCDYYPFGTRVVSGPNISGADTLFSVSNVASASTTASAKGVDGTKDTWMFFEQLQPSAVAYMDGYFYHADTRGYTFKHKNSLGTRPAIDNSKNDPADWGSIPILFYYASIDSDFGAGEVRKWVSRATLKARFSALIQTNLSVQIKSENDANGLPVATVPIEDTTNTPWGYPGVLWGSSSLFSTFSQVVDNEVMMPEEQGLRCTYKSIHLSNAIVSIQNSGDMQAQATVADGPTPLDGFGTIKKLTIPSGGLATFNEDIIGYYVKFYDVTNEEADYKYNDKKFWILSRIDDENVLVFDADNDLALASVESFDVFGFRKGDICTIQEIDVYFDVLGRGQHPYQTPSRSSGA